MEGMRLDSHLFLEPTRENKLPLKSYKKIQVCETNITLPKQILVEYPKMYINKSLLGDILQGIYASHVHLCFSK